MPRSEHYQQFLEKIYESFKQAYFEESTRALLKENEYVPFAKQLIYMGGDMYSYFNPELTAAHNYLKITENLAISDDDYEKILSDILKVAPEDPWLPSYTESLRTIRKLLKGDAPTINQYTNNALNQSNDPSKLCRHVQRYTENICNYWCDFYKHRMMTEGLLLM